MDEGINVTESTAQEARMEVARRTPARSHRAPDATASAGPFCCSPQREGLEVRFTRFVLGPADRSLHDDPDL